MLPRRIREWVDHRGPGTIGLIAAEAGVVLLTGVLVLEFLWPVRLDLGTDANLPGAEADRLPAASPTATRPVARPSTFTPRPGLFKSVGAIQDKPMADKTVERIRSQLKLRCVMHIQGEAVAYVSIKNQGVKKCRVGESVADLFTVISIQPKSIEISIVDHRVTLSL